MKLEIKSNNQQKTEEIAQLIGRKLKAGECFELVSDLGGGKTAFSRGLVKGAGSDDLVSSPTFTISNLYHSDKLNIYHFDFYRLSEPGLMTEELSEALSDEKGVTIIEWAETVKDVLPSERITINLEKSIDGEDVRLILIDYHEKFAELFKGIKA